MISSIEDIKNFLNDKNFKKIFILCGNKSFAESGAKKFISDYLINKDKDIKFFIKLSNIPEYNELTKIISEIRKFKPDLILAIGGGSVIDYAKISNVVDCSDDLPKLIKTYSYPFKKKFTKLAVIPTTAGSGAEVTSGAVIYLNNVKYSFESELLIPDNFFLVPEFLLSASNSIKASAGFDAIAQALESLISKKSNDKSFEYASKSLSIAINSYENFLKHASMKSATEMIIASNLAGKAINISKTTAPHAVSYPITSKFNISHGHAVSLFFEKFFKFIFINSNKSNASFNLRDRFNHIFKLFNVNTIEDFNSKISNIKLLGKLDDNLKNLKIDINKDSEKIIKEVNLLRLRNSPIIFEEKDIYRIISDKI